MPDNVENLTLEILKNIQAELSSVRSDVSNVGSELSSFRMETNARFERLETGMRKHRRDIAGILVLMKSAAGDFDQRVTELEERMTALESEAS